MSSGPALRLLTVYGGVGQDTGNFNNVLKGVRMRVLGRAALSKMLRLGVESWG